MSGSAEAAQKALRTSYHLIGQLENSQPLPDVLKGALEAMIRQSRSRYAFLLHNHSGHMISECFAHDPESPFDQEHLRVFRREMRICLLPQMRRSTPLIANSSTSVKSELGDAKAWRLFQRLLLIPLSSVTGDKKGLLALFGNQENYCSQEINDLEPLISLCINLLLLDEQKPRAQQTLISKVAEHSKNLSKEYDYRFVYSKDPRFITTAEGRILHHNAAAENLLAFPSEKLVGQQINRLIPRLKLNLHQGDTEDTQELKAFSKGGKPISVRVSCSAFVQHADFLFSVHLQDIRTEIESKTERHERAFRIQKQQRTTLEVARIATQEDASFPKLLREICQLTATTLKAPRAGIWLAEEESPVYRNVVQFSQSTPDYCESQPLILNHNAYFVRQLEQVRVLSISNLNSTEQNSSFLSLEYLQRNQTATLICAAFIKNSRLIGFLLIEDTRRIIWQEDQYNFAREVANYLHILVLNEHRQKIQSDLTRQEHQFQLLFFDSPLAMMAFDRESFQFIAVNHTATEVFGYTLNEMLVKGIYDLIPIQQVMDIHTLVSSNHKSSNYHVLESRMQKHSGEIVDVEIHSHSIHLSSRPAILMAVHDITEKKRIESGLRRTQKMEAVGQLVGGIAHDFNNITNIIRGHAELLELKLSDNAKATKHINAINKAAARTTSLTHKLMQFSRQQQINSEICFISDILAELLELIAKSLTKNIQIVLEVKPDTWPVMLDRGDFEDVMINLAINARDAMNGHGTLTIGAGNISLASDNPLIVRDRQPGDYVCVFIRDTGSGIPKELQEKIFDPFFTTKAKGKGTGLGLSMVYGFIKRSGGFLELESREDLGTTFYLWVPRSEFTAAGSTAFSIAPPEISVAHGYSALVVDDEEDIRSAISETLEAIGFNVTQAENVQQAQQVITAQPQGFSLVLSDIVMPGDKNGVNLAQWIKETYPQTRVILASGYAENISLQEARKVSCELLKKPFGRKELLHALSRWAWGVS